MMCVVCVLRLIVAPLPPGENPFAVKYKYNEAPHSAVFSSLLLIHRSSVRMFSAPCSQTCSVCVPSLILNFVVVLFGHSVRHCALYEKLDKQVVNP
jgi:hypothetical protein